MSASRRTTPALLIAVLAFIVIAAIALTGCGPKVPDVTGMTAEQAVRTLQDADYKLGDVRRMFTPGVPAGQIYQQDPAAGTSLRKGESVRVTVAVALGSITVPDLSKLSADEASQAIAGSQLVPVQVDQHSTDVAKGSIGGQVPAAGAKVDPGATVVYVVSMGAAPNKVKVPDITGKTQSEASAAIEKAGLKASVQRAYSDTVAKDRVMLQNPAKGASVDPGSLVSYVLSLGKSSKSVTVPNVVGRREADASSALSGAGLSVQVNRQQSATVAKGVVISQMPPAGSKTAAGGVVGIVVSLGSDSTIAVPDVTGRSSADARRAIEAAGLVAYPVDQPSADVDEGNVILQLPVSGSRVPAGSSVLYAVSSGTPE
ncbi:MAG: PASTA domain-containing protein [Coriobacteriia bacterium]|nr:PASTA domain-containing protein [Coriobacteriia bacterium]